MNPIAPWSSTDTSYDYPTETLVLSFDAPAGDETVWFDVEWSADGGFDNPWRSALFGEERTIQERSCAGDGDIAGQPYATRISTVDIAGNRSEPVTAQIETGCGCAHTSAKPFFSLWCASGWAVWVYAARKSPAR